LSQHKLEGRNGITWESAGVGEPDRTVNSALNAEAVRIHPLSPISLVDVIGKHGVPYLLLLTSYSLWITVLFIRFLL